MMWDRFNQFMDGDVETHAGRVVHAIVFGLMGAALFGLLESIFGLDDRVYMGFHVPGWVDFGGFSVFWSVSETSRRTFWRREQRIPTRGECAFIGFKCSAAYGVFGIWGVSWAFGYDGSWTSLMLMVIAFIVFWTALEVLLSNWYFKRLEERAQLGKKLSRT